MSRDKYAGREASAQPLTQEAGEHLVIGICNPDVGFMKYSKANPHRLTQKANPFSYYDRYQMIKGTLSHMGGSAEEFDIIPFPINYPELIFNYAPPDAKYLSDNIRCMEI